MSSNEKNICNLLREKWRSLIVLIDYLSTLLRKILSKIQALINRIKNTILRRLLSTIRDIRDVISNFLGLQSIDNNQFRSDVCSIMYKCSPLVEELAKFISPELFNEIFGPDSIKTIDLSKYGIASITFNSKFELFEYVACRLSLRGLLDSVVSSFTNQLLEFVSKFEKYLDINWWLDNTVWGRELKLLINEYEAIFSQIKKYLSKLDPYLNCTFALCDFSVSTKNYFEDFSTKFKAERQQQVDLFYNWVVLKEDLYSDLTYSLNDAKSELQTFKTTLSDPVVNNNPNFHYKTTNESKESTELKDSTNSDSQRLPYNSDEMSKIKNNLYNRKSSLVPGVTEGNIVNLRPIIRLSSPNSEG